jgi:adenosine deaminase
MERETIKRLPKVELHCHLDGSVSIDAIKRLADINNVEIPTDEAELRRKISVSKECRDLKDYLNCFSFVLPLLQTKESLTLAAYDVMKQASDETICYIELRFSPLQHMEQGLSQTEVVRAVIEGVKQGNQDFNVDCGLILCMMRHRSEKDNQEVVEVAKQLKDEWLLAVDLAGDEARYDTELFEKPIAIAHNYHLPMTLHAGECGNQKNIVDSIRFGATRIGHGLTMKDTMDIKQLCADSKTHVEMCPTSNLQTRAIDDIANYPFMKYLELGIPVSINTDNRTVSNTTLTDEICLLDEHFDISYGLLKEITLISINQSFVSDNKKEKIIKYINEEYKNVEK